jgi:hypothetical protein
VRSGRVAHFDAGEWRQGGATGVPLSHRVKLWSRHTIVGVSRHDRRIVTATIDSNRI